MCAEEVLRPGLWRLSWEAGDIQPSPLCALKMSSVPAESFDSSVQLHILPHWGGILLHLGKCLGRKNRELSVQPWLPGNGFKLPYRVCLSSVSFRL